MREIAAPGSPEAKAISRMRRSWLRRGSRGRDRAMELSLFPCPLTVRVVSLEPVALQAPVQRASAQAERLGRLTDVAVKAGHRLLDEEALDFFEAHVLEPPA